MCWKLTYVQLKTYICIQNSKRLGRNLEKVANNLVAPWKLFDISFSQPIKPDAKQGSLLFQVPQVSLFTLWQEGYRQMQLEKVVGYSYR